jgi:hypothetical protein
MDFKRNEREMGIMIEFNPALALRSEEEFIAGNRKKEECIPGKIRDGDTISFLKKGQRNYYLKGEIPLVKTRGSGNISSPLASVIIKECTHFIDEEEVLTRGKYEIMKVFDCDCIHFEGLERIKCKHEDG